MIGRAIIKPAKLIDVEQVDLGSASAITVTDDGYRVSRYEHFVIPVALRVHAGSKSIDRVHRL